MIIVMVGKTLKGINVSVQETPTEAESECKGESAAIE